MRRPRTPRLLALFGVITVIGASALAVACTPPSGTTPPTTTTTTATPPAGTAFADEFDGSAVNASKWNIYTGTVSYDQACYTAGNVQVSGGVLTIHSRLEANSCNSSTKPYTTGYVRTSAAGSGGEKFALSPTTAPSKIIRLEIRAQLPAQQVGVWPAIWTRNNYGSLGPGTADCSATSSTPYGEVDLMERWGDEPNTATYRDTTWTKCLSTPGSNGSVTKPSSCPTAGLNQNCADLTTGMHTYATEIDVSGAGQVRYYLDGRLITRHTAADTPGLDAASWLNSLKGKWDVRLMTEIEKGDAWHAAPNPATFQPATLTVDWVHVFTK